MIVNNSLAVCHGYFIIQTYLKSKRRRNAPVVQRFPCRGCPRAWQVAQAGLEKRIDQSPNLKQ